MNISAIRSNNLPLNNQTFTSNDEEIGYVKSNAGKFIGLGGGLGYAVGIVNGKGGWESFKKNVRENFAKSLNESRNTGVTETFTETSLTGQMLKTAYLRKAAIVSAVVVGCLLVGAIVDGIVNTVSRKKAQLDHY